MLKSLSHVRIFETPWTVACQAPVSMGFPSQEYWSGCYFFLQGIFLIQGLNPRLQHLLNWKADFFTIEPSGKPPLWHIVIAQLLSHVQLFVIPWTAACQAPLPFTISQSLLRFMSIESVMLSNHLILCYPLFLLPSLFPSFRVFSDKLTLCIR